MAEARKAVEDLVRLSSRVIRILGQNPGSYTLAGTNTYLISTPPVTSSKLVSRPSVLVDTGEGIESYIPILERALKGAVDGDELTKPESSKRQDENEEDEEDEDDRDDDLSPNSARVPRATGSNKRKGGPSSGSSEDSDRSISHNDDTGPTRQYCTQACLLGLKS